ncbi:hypothetical protein KM043_016583 [Ampulex compressa]|nr:hypothetical protein KM043_016583 [Ampulex compressa]
MHKRQKRSGKRPRMREYSEWACLSPGRMPDERANEEAGTPGWRGVGERGGFAAELWQNKEEREKGRKKKRNPSHWRAGPFFALRRAPPWGIYLGWQKGY